MPQQLCHYVGGNYESDENGEGERIGAKAVTLERERNCQLDPDVHGDVFKLKTSRTHGDVVT